jgi:hypothetical protein
MAKYRASRASDKVKTYVRPVLRLTPARKAETRTASKAKWVRRPSWWVVLVEVVREGSGVRSFAHHHDGCVVGWVIVV